MIGSRQIVCHIGRMLSIETAIEKRRNCLHKNFYEEQKIILL